MLAALRALGRFLRREGTLPVNPLIDMESPRWGRTLPQVLALAEVERLLAQPSGVTPIGRRDRAMLEVAYGSVLRVSELVRFPLCGLHLADAWLTVIGKGAKTRLVPMGEPAIAAVQSYLNGARDALLDGRRSAAVFVNWRGARMTRQGFWMVLQGYGRAAGIRTRLYPHVLRHTFATHLLEGRADLLSIKEMLGHADLSSTEIYTHVSPAHLPEAYFKYHPRA